MPSMILLVYAPIIIALLLSLSGDVEVNPGPVPFNITQHATPMPIYMDHLTKAPINLTMSIS
jgi:hypothetical protein